MTRKTRSSTWGSTWARSRSSISASNGQRHVIESYVGWPLDMVARRVLKKPVLIGREALENRSMLDLHRPLEEGLIKDGSEKDEAAVRELLRHLLSLVGVEPDARNGMKVRAVVGVPAEALRVNKQQVRKALQNAVDSLLIVSEPFAVAYGIEALLHTMIIDSGAGTTDFCVMNGRLPTEEDQRTLAQAGDFVDETLMRLVRGRYPEAKFSDPHGPRVEGGGELRRARRRARWSSPPRSTASRPSSTSPRTCARPARASCRRWSSRCSTCSPGCSPSTRRRCATTSSSPAAPG